MTMQSLLASRVGGSSDVVVHRVIQVVADLLDFVKKALDHLNE